MQAYILEGLVPVLEEVEGQDVLELEPLGLKDLRGRKTASELAGPPSRLIAAHRAQRRKLCKEGARRGYRADEGGTRDKGC